MKKVILKTVAESIAEQIFNRKVSVSLKETKELLTGFFTAVEAVFKSAEDGKLTISDLANFLNFGAYSAAVDNLSGNMFNELVNATNPEFLQTIEECKKEFVLSNQRELETDIENISIAVLSGLRIVARDRAAKKNQIAA
jgi:hypothetical protein